MIDNINKIHNDAMDLAEAAFIARFKGEENEATELFAKAFGLEQKVVQYVLGSGEEPSRSILCRSAASLALNARMYREAEIMISYGLIGDPPEEIAEELRDILEDVHFGRHLKKKGVELHFDEIQFSISGPSVGYGIVRSDEFNNRIYSLEKLSYRIGERIFGKPFRTKGNVSKDIRDLFRTYYSVPRPASFSITIKFGQQAKINDLFGHNPVEKMINDLFENFELINNNKFDELNERIGDEDYYSNFVGLAKKIYPDRENISVVGLTTKTGKEEREIALIKPKHKIIIPQKEMEKEGEQVEIDGILTYASAPTEEIKLTDENGEEYKILVPRSLLSDIVRPYWEEKVRVYGKKVGRSIYFEDLEKIE